MFKVLLSKFIKLSRPLVWRMARAYSLAITEPPHATGQNPLVIQGGEYQAANQIPRSCYFNTRSGSIVIGSNTVFGENVMVLTGKHLNYHESHEKSVNLHEVPGSGRDVKIGCGCYVGSGAIIIGPVEVGDYDWSGLCCHERRTKFNVFCRKSCSY